MGPDEYAYPVNNSAYTNTVVKIALAFAVEAAAVLGETAPPEWAAVAAGLIVPFEPEAGSIPEFQSRLSANRFLDCKTNTPIPNVTLTKFALQDTSANALIQRKR